MQVCCALKDILAPLTPHLVHEIESYLGGEGEYSDKDVSRSAKTGWERWKQSNEESLKPGFSVQVSRC